MRTISINTGNMIAESIPVPILPPAASATKPASPGPTEHPTSPASARNANIAVPPPGRILDAMLNVPGQNMPTEKPVSAQPARLRNGYGERDIRR